MFVLDYNKERSLQISSEEEKVDDLHFTKETMDFDGAVQSLQAKVHVETLSPYIHFGGGVFTMTAVKRMRSTDAFLEMPQRNCELESYEDCRTRKLMGECNCVLWELPGYQVSTTKKLGLGIIK